MRSIVFRFALHERAYRLQTQQAGEVYRVRGQAHQAQFSDDKRQHERQVNRHQVGHDHQVIMDVHGSAIVRKT